MLQSGRVSSSQELDGSSGLIGGLSIGPRDVTPIILARQTKFRLIAQSMRQMDAKHLDEPRQILQLPLDTAFMNALKSAGLAKPEFSVTQCRGFFQVSLSLDIAGKSTVIQGDLCGTQEKAQSNAIERALVTLKRLQHVVLVDISARKHKIAIRNSKNLYLKGCSALCVVDSMLTKWLRCLDDLGLVEKFAEEHLKVGNDVQRKYTDAVCYGLMLLKGASKVNISKLDAKFRALRAEKDKYVAASRSEPIFLPQIPKKKAYFDDADALAHLLSCLNLNVCQFSEELDDNGLILGAVNLTFPGDQNSLLWAKHHKTSVAKARNAAAREAIFYLEDRFKVVLAGSNHNACVLAEQETFVWKGLLEEIVDLGDNVTLLWTEMMKNLGETLDRQRRSQAELAQRGRVGGEMDFINNLLDRLELASSKCNETFNVAVAEFASLK